MLQEQFGGEDAVFATRNRVDRNTQLGCIRDLMLGATLRGDWLSLAEIAAATEYGEASISAQLRHLRKIQHGRYRVEKRLRRPLHSDATARNDGVWEYCVSAYAPGGDCAKTRD